MPNFVEVPEFLNRITLGLAVFPALLSTLNWYFWKKTPKVSSHKSLPKISILIPARNEEGNIAACIDSILKSDLYICGMVQEICIYNDQSTDQTGLILQGYSEKNPKIKVINGKQLPPSWQGKAHACHQLALSVISSAAQDQQYMLFLDADVRLAEQSAAILQGFLAEYQPDLLTAVPAQKMVTWSEHLLLPILYITYTSWFFIPLIWQSRDPRFLAANGQYILISKDTYESTGGYSHPAVKQDIVDDMALCRMVKKSHRRVILLDGAQLASCRMYKSAQEVWDGFSKNMAAGVGGSIFAYVLVSFLYFACFIWPYIALFLLPNPYIYGAVIANIWMRMGMALRFGHPWWHIFAQPLLQPLAMLGFLAIFSNSYRWYWQKRIAWKGREYAR